ncbi:RDD family protein [Sanguibacter sp. 25GB23B1]|uniref:RDD family protein n=1 Tax=unclassified Sanguibacter TaxID=2645534 RepID=UPI0032AED43E
MSFAPPPPRIVPPGPQVSALGGCVPAAPGRRAGAAVLDSVILALPAGAASVCTSIGLAEEMTVLVVIGGVLALLTLAGLVLVGVGFATSGLSPGKRAMGLRLVSVRTGGAPGFGTWLRFVLAGLGSAVLVGWVLAVVQVLRDAPGDRRTWYDTATDVALLDVVAGRDPFVGAAVARAAGAVPPPPAGSFAGATPPPLAAVPTLVTMDGAPLHPVDVAPAGPAAVPVPPPPPPPAPGDTDDLDQTRATADIRAQREGAEPPVVALLTFDSGVVENVTGRGLVGRKPRLADGADGTILVVDDDTRTVSKTHLELVVEKGGVRVTDLWSTNGSTVIAPQGDTTTLDAGSPVLALYGSTVTVGDHWFTVSRVMTPQDAFDDAGDTILRGPR